jgi:AAA ATPase domain
MPAPKSKAKGWRPASNGAWAGSPVFLGRESEERRLRAAILNAESLTIEGPAGIGKTALVMHTIQSLPASLAARCLYFTAMKDLQDLLRQLIRTLHEAGDPRLRRQLHTERVSSLSLAGWLKELSTSRLKGTLYRAVEGGDYRIFLDHLPPLTHAIAKVIKELFWMRRTPVYLVPRAEAQETISRFRHFFYWGDHERLALGALPRPAAHELLENCIDRFGLVRFDLTDFREEVLELSRNIPGAIVKMCALAADARYQYGTQIKIKSAYVEYLITGHELGTKEFSATKPSAALSKSISPGCSYP